MKTYEKHRKTYEINIKSIGGTLGFPHGKYKKIIGKPIKSIGKPMKNIGKPMKSI